MTHNTVTGRILTLILPILVAFRYCGELDIDAGRPHISDSAIRTESGAVEKIGLATVERVRQERCKK